MNWNNDTGHEYCISISIAENRNGNGEIIKKAQLSPRDRAMRRVNWNLANCHATAQKLRIHDKS